MPKPQLIEMLELKTIKYSKIPTPFQQSANWYTHNMGKLEKQNKVFQLRSEGELKPRKASTVVLGGIFDQESSEDKKRRPDYLADLDGSDVEDEDNSEDE